MQRNHEQRCSNPRVLCRFANHKVARKRMVVVGVHGGRSLVVYRRQAQRVAQEAATFVYGLLEDVRGSMVTRGHEGGLKLERSGHADQAGRMITVKAPSIDARRITSPGAAVNMPWIVGERPRRRCLGSHT